eukprot:gnl/MRDRNA2_/MRDRNA2_195438_c0_seq1.p1 gnl/MRDRNA2_/MRDRNA2_195438_c0~~gnl/MRDRNA2_/MRDRNA2_195438_c0_seq1.p1  ORF type:complete len:457 (-),score=70.29 gnl/MRDRNA2_/MRDRNA2_195438_c0_seq1:8-1378(-)
MRQCSLLGGNRLLALCCSIFGRALLTWSQSPADQVFQWFQKKGWLSKNIALGKNSEGLRGVFVTQDVPRGSVLMEIPSDLQFTLSEQEQEAVERLPWPAGLKPERNVAVMAGLVAALLGDTQAPFGSGLWAFNTTLPADCSRNVFALSRGELALLETMNNPANQMVLLRKSMLWGARTLTSNSFTGAQISLVACHVLSRAFNNLNTMVAGLPMIDLMNHNLDHTVRLDLDGPLPHFSKQRGAIATSSKDLQKGEELLIRYLPDDRPISEVEYYAQHGFVPRERKTAAAMLRIKLSMAHKEADALEKFGCTVAEVDSETTAVVIFLPKVEDMSLRAVSESLRCLRFWAYGQEEALKAQALGYLDDGGVSSMDATRSNALRIKPQWINLDLRITGGLLGLFPQEDRKAALQAHKFQSALQDSPLLGMAEIERKAISACYRYIVKLRLHWKSLLQHLGS